MSKTSKSPKRILQVAHQLGKQRLRTYSHKFSPKKFTLPQLFACLVLKEFLRLDYRKLSALLEDAPCLASVINLKQVPHFSTFQKASSRLLESRRVQLLLSETVEAATTHRVMRKKVTLAAIDGTGFESRHVSRYFVRRREKSSKTSYQSTTYSRYPIANLLCDCASHMVLAFQTGRGPGPDDPYFQPTVEQAAKRTTIQTLLADAGYDSEAAHRFAREEHGMRTIIPATRGRRTKKRLSGYWRNRMKTRFNQAKYGQRWQVETVNSMIKRTMGAALRARSYWS